MEKNVPSFPRNAYRGLRDALLLLFAVFFFFTALAQPGWSPGEPGSVPPSAASSGSQPILLKHLAPGSTHFTAVNGRLFYASGDSLHTSEGTPAGTMLVAKVNEPIISISKLSIGSSIFFITQTGSQQSLWTSDGTESNTVKIGTHHSILPVIVYQSELYLQIDDGIHGKELWKLSGGNMLTMLKDIHPGSASGFSRTNGTIAVSNNTLFFFATSNDVDHNLWTTNGTPEGTVLAVDIPFEASYDSPGNLTDVDGTMFFSQTYFDDRNDYASLWKTQGTETTTELVKEFTPEQFYNELAHFTPLNGKLYFFRLVVTPEVFLWVSDGTEAGTKQVIHVTTDGGVESMGTLKDRLVFHSQSQSNAGPVQVSDGTPEGTTVLHDFSWSYDHSAVNFTLTTDFLFFVDHIDFDLPGSDLHQLWQSDLTPGNTVPLKELYGMSFRNSHYVVAAGSTIFFTTSDPNLGFRLWHYDPLGATPCADAGGILREVWDNIPGRDVSLIPVNTPPSLQEVVNVFEGPVNAGDRYGSRYRGYLCVPQTGEYRFWISSNDKSQLFLSTNATPEDKVLIAAVNDFTDVYQYNKYPVKQQSPLITLQAGTLYYIEALHKEGVGTDHISVQMQYPDGTIENPIQGTRLIPYNSNIAPVVAITHPVDGEVLIDPSHITIEADAFDVDGAILKVEFFVKHPHSSATKVGEDNAPPYSFSWTPPQYATYELHARAIDNEGLAGLSEKINITVTGCLASGTILREVWTGFQGNKVSDIPWEIQPHSISYLDNFEAPTDIGNNYGTRIRGYICPPATGAYEFFIASNDHSELWLSTTGDPKDKQLIAFVTGATAEREWDKYTSQRSESIRLDEGHLVYIEALHKEGVGTDHIAVGWRMPGNVFERPIPGNRLSPFEPLGNEGGEARMASAGQGEMNLSPNPSRQESVTLALNSLADESSGYIHVEIVSMIGEVMYSQPVTCQGSCNEIVLDVTRSFTPGVYIVKSLVNNKVFSQRLVVH